ncbi:MAG: RsmB/NOP family class I SAM-dependent RNA methyltransferase [Hyphomicrobiaceae bacterium]
MRPGGRLTAAIEVLGDILERHRPAADALADWGKAHRFAGSGDRAAIGNLVYDALRLRLSTAHRMGRDTPRALAIGVAASAWAMAPEAVLDLMTGLDHSPDPAGEDERHGVLGGAEMSDAAEHVRADVPDWLWPAFSASLGDAAVAEGAALSTRAPVDIRVNLLKAAREKVEKALGPFGAVPTPLSPVGLRIRPAEGTGRTANVQAETAFQKGQFEIQDEGSQIAALIAGAAHASSGQVLDLCAGGGGKSLALAAQKGNRGQVFATDADRHRLAPIHERLKRAGARNVQVRPARAGALDDLEGRMDLVLIDAPCTGTGVWRRKPDAKWRLKPEALARRLAEQDAVLAEGARFVRPGGRLCYVTCSLLEAENGERIAQFLKGHTGFRPLAMAPLWQAALGADAPFPGTAEAVNLLLTPARTKTDGFFVAVIERM